MSTSLSDVPSAGSERTQARTQLGQWPPLRGPAAATARLSRGRFLAPNPILKVGCHRRHDLLHLKCFGLIFAFDPEDSLRSVFFEACRVPEPPHDVRLFRREGHTRASHWTENNDEARAAAWQVCLLSRRRPHVPHECSTSGPVTLAKMTNVLLKP